MGTRQPESDEERNGDSLDERSGGRLGIKAKTCSYTQHKNFGRHSTTYRCVAADVVKIMGRWLSDAFIGYTRYQAELMAGIA
jgi:hypothetical protein